MNQLELLDLIKNRLRSNQANYQPIVLRCLINKPVMNIKDIQIELAKANNNDNIKQYGLSYCPFWKVLKNKHLISIMNETVILNVKVDNLKTPILNELKKLGGV